MRHRACRWLASSRLPVAFLFPAGLLLAPVVGWPALVSQSSLVSSTPPKDTVAVAMSGEGRFVVVASAAAGLTADEVDGRHVQLFLRDLAQGEIRLITRGPGGGGGGNSGGAVLSRDGRWVGFSSEAPDLVPDDTNGFSDVFLSDGSVGTLKLVSRSAEGAASAAGASSFASMSADGEWLAYTSTATNLVEGIVDGNNAVDVFLYGADSGATRIRSRQLTVAQTGAQLAADPVVSPDGRWVAFTSPSVRLAAGTPTIGTDSKLYLHDVVANTNRWASGGAAGFSNPVPVSRRHASKAVFSDDGRFLVYAVGPRVLRFATETEASTLVATILAEAGLPAFGTRPLAVNADGGLIAFPGTTANAFQAARAPEAVYVWRSATGGLEVLPAPFADVSALGQVGAAAVSSDGRYIAYLGQVVSPPADLAIVPGWHWFRHDLEQGITSVVSVSATVRMPSTSG